MSACDLLHIRCARSKPKSKPRRRCRVQPLQAGARSPLTNVLALDVEFAHYKALSGRLQQKHVAEVCIVDIKGEPVYHSYCTTKAAKDPKLKWCGGVPLPTMKNVPSVKDVAADVSRWIEGQVLVGHGLKPDLTSFMLTHPPHLIRDTMNYPKFQRKKGKALRLKELAKIHLNLDVQIGKHCARDDAAITMKLFVQCILPDMTQHQNIDEMVHAYLCLQDILRDDGDDDKHLLLIRESIAI